MAGMDRSRDEGLGSNARCIASSTARSLQSMERVGRLPGRDVVRGNLSLRLPAAFNAGAGHRPVLSWTMEKRMRLDECTFWMRGPPETDDFCPGQEGRQGERADESLTSAPGTTTRPWVLSPANDADSSLLSLLHAPWPVRPGAVLARLTPAIPTSTALLAWWCSTSHFGAKIEVCPVSTLQAPREGLGPYSMARALLIAIQAKLYTGLHPRNAKTPSLSPTRARGGLCTRPSSESKLQAITTAVAVLL